jgi:hypothetical protein
LTNLYELTVWLIHSMPAPESEMHSGCPNTRARARYTKQLFVFRRVRKTGEVRSRLKSAACPFGLFCFRITPVTFRPSTPRSTMSLNCVSEGESAHGGTCHPIGSGGVGPRQPAEESAGERSPTCVCSSCKSRPWPTWKWPMGKWSTWERPFRKWRISRERRVLGTILSSPSASRTHSQKSTKRRDPSAITRTDVSGISRRIEHRR